MPFQASLPLPVSGHAPRQSRAVPCLQRLETAASIFSFFVLDGACKGPSIDDHEVFRALQLPRSFSPIELVSSLQSCYGGKVAEEIEGLFCSRCSARASQHRCLLEGLCGSPSAQQAYRRLQAFGNAIREVEHLSVLCPAGSPDPVLCRTTHFRSFEIQKAPAILTLHMRRLIHGPWGLVRLANPVRCPALLLLDKVLGNYALASVVSHLGTASQGHFIAHRAWHPGAQSGVQSNAQSYAKDEYIPRAVSGKVELWSSAQWASSRLSCARAS